MSFIGFGETSMEKLEKAVRQFIESCQRELGSDAVPLKITLTEKVWKHLWQHLSSKSRYACAPEHGLQQIKVYYTGAKPLEIDYVPDPEKIEITREQLDYAIKVIPYTYTNGEKFPEEVWKRLKGGEKK